VKSDTAPLRIRQSGARTRIEPVACGTRIAHTHLSQNQLSIGMMKDSRTSIRLLFATIFLVSACTTLTPPQEPEQSSGNYVDDVAITSRVKAALTAARLTDADAIRVETVKGVVELDGVVDSEAAKTQAERIASQTRGVRQVDNRLSIR
jgi:hyperosmotically inducible protein